MASQRSRLRNEANLPRFVIARFNKAMMLVSRECRQKIGVLEDLLRRTSYVENLDADSPLAVGVCESELPDALVHVDTPQHPHVERAGERAWRKTTVDKDRWKKYVASLVDGRPAAERELVSLRAQLAAGTQEAEGYLDFYVNQL
jgi:hypothetical protein